MITFSILVINSYRQILNIISAPPHSLSNSLIQTFLMNHHLLSPKPTHSTLSTKTILWLHWNLKFTNSSVLSEAVICLLPSYAYPPLSTGISHFVLGPLGSINALFLMWKNIYWLSILLTVWYRLNLEWSFYK